ncbi:MAG: ATP-binding protein [Acidimicrobiia bacterium]|nr:ATP-binding protein [Acidimicrobiia bacterium]
MQGNHEPRYEMGISLRVLDHLGLNLYSNTPAVISEAIANAWDADATQVVVTLDHEANTITVADNGHGMNLKDINSRYLMVGYRRRIEQGPETPKGRKPMGRKGIGKLSLFSIANEIRVSTKKEKSEPEAFVLDAHKIRETVEAQEEAARDKNDFTMPRYHPQPVKFDEHALFGDHGTAVKIASLKMNLTQSSVVGLRKRIARRFGLLADDFKISVNGCLVEFAERDYFHKARFIFQYGSYDYASHCPNLDESESSSEVLAFKRASRFDDSGKSNENGLYQVGGWIAISRRSNDLDDRTGEQDDNLNKITVLMRGKVAQEDILQEYRLGGLFTKFIFGEIHADFLDDDYHDDIATTSRQHLAEDHPHYKALKAFIGGELRHIWTETNKLKQQRELKNAIDSNPHVKRWYKALPATLKKYASSVFRGIDVANMDDEHRHKFYANAVLAFEHLKTRNALSALEEIPDENLEAFLNWLADMDAIESIRYQEIITERLTIIDEFEKRVNDNDYERVLEQYLFEHLWLLDPAWERATEYAHMEQQIQNAIERTAIRDKLQVRPDIRYRRISGGHVIIELKRPSVRIRKTDIENQLGDYIAAVKKYLDGDEKESRYPIDAICLLENAPIGWDNPEVRARDEESLRIYGIRVMTYRHLITQARSGYAKFIKERAPVIELSETVESIRSYRAD